MIVFREELKMQSKVCTSFQVILVMLSTKWSISNATMTMTFQMKMDWSKRLKETRNALTIRPLDFEKKWWFNSEDCTAEYQWTHMRLSPLCYFPNLHWSVVSLWGAILNIFLAWLFFNALQKGIATRWAEAGREHPVGQPFCNTHTALVCLHLTFISLIYLV